MIKVSDLVLYFFIGGSVTTLIVALEESGLPWLSYIATLFPVFTWISYLFIGTNSNGTAVVSNAKFVLIGTVVAWIPYMLSIIYFTPKLGVTKAILISIGVFLAIASAYVLIYPLFFGQY